MDLRLRRAEAQDASFLAQMLVAAAFWRPDGPPGSVEEVLGRPELAHYLAGWPRAGDLGVVAISAVPVGAAWLRFLPEGDPGYGFVDSNTPELVIGVVAGCRQHGVGTQLLEELITRARRARIEAISLSVARDNGARGLYERFGFEEVASVDDAITMTRHL